MKEEIDELKIINGLIDTVVEKIQLTVARRNFLPMKETYELESTLIQILTAKLKILEIIKGLGY